MPENLVAVPKGPKLKLAADLVLNAFDRVVGKFDHVFTVYADHVVVMRA